MAYTVNKIAQLAGVTIRTLRYYDKIGLLVPSERTDAGYRLYSAADLEKLQQILLFRELDFPLSEIGKLLKDPGFDRREALRMQIEFLKKKAERYCNLSKLAQKTLDSLEGGIKMSNEELFKGFDYDKMMEDQKKYEPEVKERWGGSEAYRISKERTAKYTKEDWERFNEEQMTNLKELCSLFSEKVSPEDARVQDIVAKAHKFINDTFYPCSLEIFSGLGNMYVSDERFTAYYDKFAEGLAAYYNEAIQYYCISNT